MNPGDFGTGGACSYKGPACGQCWSISGPGGSARIQVTDCCAGYSNHASCLVNPQDPQCDWCAANDNQHFDLDSVSYNTVCGSEAGNGHCVLSSAVQIQCPSSAVADQSSATFGTTPADTTPSWAIALIVVCSLIVVILLVLIGLLYFRTKAVVQV